VRVIKFCYGLPLDQSMSFEALYPEPLQLDLPQKQQVWDVPGSIFAWMYVNGKLAGETYGIPLDDSDELLEQFTDIRADQNKSAIHCYSNTILPSFQEQGLGTLLKAHWLGLAAGRGFEVVYGYARPGGSQSLNAKFGAAFLAAFPDWYGTGEEYKLYRLNLT
jgi:GNAT superfamily N-acetyltransferase